MARTKKSEIQARYREQERQAKEAYKKEKGLKIARGFNQTRAAKKIQRNRRRAITHYKDRKLTEKVEKQVFSVQPEKISRFDVIVDKEFYFKEIYSPTGDSFIVNQFRLAEAGTSKPVRAIIQDEDGSVTVYRTLFEFELAMSRLYTELNKRQTDEWKAANKAFRNNPANKGKTMPKSEFIRLVTITSGETKDYEILTLKVEKP